VFACAGMTAKALDSAFDSVAVAASTDTDNQHQRVRPLQVSKMWLKRPASSNNVP